MKCELCHAAEAKTAIIREDDNGEEQELYVCEACAKSERQHRQRLASRTRKLPGLPPGMEISISEIRSNGEGGIEDGGEIPPPDIGAIVGAFSDAMSEIFKSRPAELKKPTNEKFNILDASRAPEEFKVRDLFHLEGLHLIGEIDAVKRAARALKMELVGVDADGVKDSAHAYKLKYSGNISQAMRVMGDIMREETNARKRLVTELPRTFGDGICRALAILKNCRYLSQGEYFDLLSPIRLATMEGLLDGITYDEVKKIMDDIVLNSANEGMGMAERDMIDGELADVVNQRFEKVMLNERAEGCFL